MNCKKCAQRLEIKQTYEVEGVAKVQRARCGPCDMDYTVVCVSEAIENKGRGLGAHAVNERIRRGKIVPKLDLGILNAELSEDEAG